MRMSEVEHGVGLSPQTRSVAPAAIFARVQLRNFRTCERPSCLASRRFAHESPTPCSHIWVDL